MCLILDTNCFGDFLNQGNPDMHPVRKWLRKNGKLVYSSTNKLKQELNSVGKMKNLFNEYSQSGKLKKINKDEVRKQSKKLRNLKSNDEDIIALALISNTKILVSNDKNLHEDFKTTVVKGKVYQNKSHARLLTPDLCP